MHIGWRIAAAILLGIYLVLLFGHDPEQGGFLPCPFRWLTGWDCPGCGAQRALHDLMHGRLREAFGHNALLVIALPLLAVQWGLSRVPGSRPPTARNAVVWSWAALLIGWGVVRNLT